MVLPDFNFSPPEEQEEEVNNPPASQNLCFQILTLLVLA
jgi:hypothetical protein